jgi:hypothetical protein
MNKDDIIRMAREVGLSNDFENFGYPYLPELEHFATLVYERAFIDGMQKQMQSSVDKAVNKMAQREWQRLTDEELRDIFDSCQIEDRGYVAAMVEAKLKEKNT